MIPKVFGNGDVTVAMNLDGISIWASQTRIDHVMSFEAKYGPGQPVLLEISFYESHDPETALRIEESMRAARSIPWIRIRTSASS